MRTTLVVALVAVSCRDGTAPPAPACAIAGRVNAPAVVRVDAPGTPNDRPATHRVVYRAAQPEPRVLAIRTGDTVEFISQDSSRHALHDDPPTFDWKRSNRSLLGVRKFLAAGPARILCHDHPAERVDLLVVDTPHFAVAAPDGAWRIEGVPVGNKTLTAWDPARGETATVKMTGCDAAPTLRFGKAQP